MYYEARMIPKDTWTEYRGILVSQCVDIFNTMDKFFDKEDFDLIIETGTYRGGFTFYLGDKFHDKVHSFDMKDDWMDIKDRPRILETGCKLYNEDIFETDTIKDLITSCTGRTLLLLDNGNKLEELRMFHSYLKNDDMVMLHDYHPKMVKIRTGSRKKWYACDVDDKSFYNLNIKSLGKHTKWYHTMKNVFWLCLELQ